MAVAAQGKNERTASAPQGQQKRNNRNRRNHPQPIPQLDGTVSDSVTNPIASPRSKQAPQQRRSVAADSNMGTSNGQRPRPVSVGGHMLPATPAKEQAYAGPTFHASPAPSSLPVPKFFCRSVPNVAAQPSLQACMEGEGTLKEQESSPEPDAVASVPSDALQSPLDLFFKADKAEKYKEKSGSNLLSPVMATRQPPATEPRNPFQQAGKSIFLRELDGDSEDMPSPRTVPPKARPSLAERSQSSPGIRPQSPKDEEQREAYTQSLKDLLFNSVNAGSAQKTTPPQTHQRAKSDAQALQTPSPFQRPASGPSTPTPQTDPQDHYALHYGNRNLSPLFKSARNDTPSRPSSLRQQLPNDSSAMAGHQPPPRQLPQLDPNSFSRVYLDEHIRASQPAPLPPTPFANALSGNRSSAPFSGPSASSLSSASQHGVPVESAASTSPRTGGSRDIRSMEDDLRRMLKLN